MPSPVITRFAGKKSHPFHGWSFTIADVVLRAGLFSQPDLTPAIVANLFSAIDIMALVTTLMPPIGLRLIVSQES